MKMRSVYQVVYFETVEERKGDRPVAGSRVTVNVVSDGAEKAIAKVREKKIGEQKKWYDDEAEKEQVSTTVEIDIESVACVASIDF